MSIGHRTNRVGQRMITWDHVWSFSRQSVTPDHNGNTCDSACFKLIGALGSPKQWRQTKLQLIAYFGEERMLAV
jgi:hypothetical protein